MFEYRFRVTVNFGPGDHDRYVFMVEAVDETKRGAAEQIRFALNPDLDRGIKYVSGSKRKVNYQRGLRW